MGRREDVTERHYTTSAHRAGRAADHGSRRSPLPQLVLDVPLVEDVPLGVLHQEHDYGSAATTAVRPLSTLTPKVFDKPNKMFDFLFFYI